MTFMMESNNGVNMSSALATPAEKEGREPCVGRTGVNKRMKVQSTQLCSVSKSTLALMQEMPVLFFKFFFL